MTNGRIGRDLRELTNRVIGLEGARNGSAFTDKQTGQINEIAKEHAGAAQEHSKTLVDQMFHRLIIWCVLAAFAGGASVVGSVVFAYLKLRG